MVQGESPVTPEARVSPVAPWTQWSDTHTNTNRMRAGDLDASYRFCAEVSRRAAKNFHWTFRLLPHARRSAMHAVYAFFRRTDDIADDPAPLADRRQGLEDWRRRLTDALTCAKIPENENQNHHEDWPGFPALRDAVDRYGIPHRHLHAVIDGVTRDLSPVEYQTQEDLEAYCDLVASAVGLSCLHIWGFRSENGKAEERAVACGRALQLTNILRDIGEDARNGRIYLPSEDRRLFAVPDADFTADRVSPELRALMASIAARAEAHYQLGSELPAYVAPQGRAVLNAIVGVYRALLQHIRDARYEVLNRRISVPRWRKLAILGRSWLHAHASQTRNARE